jgi:GMP synthase (glutamine-hydrolysing)
MILVVDFGSQTAHLIGRRLRQLGVAVSYCDPNDAANVCRREKPKGIIFSGGPSSVYDAGAPSISKKIFDLGIPILGICYGWQLIAYRLGGEVKNTTKEYGPEKIIISNPIGIYSFPKKEFTVIVSHGDSVIRLPIGFSVAGSSTTVPNSAVANESKKIYGVQFHPEADHTEYGLNLLQKFAANVCGETLRPLILDPESIIRSIKTTVGSPPAGEAGKKVICAVSGGVDSTVTAFFIARAIGNNLIPVYIDSGLMRPETDVRLTYIFSKLIHARLTIVDAKKQFLAALKGITDPEEKRKTIGKLYIDLFEKEAKKHEGVAFLAQGTIYSDVIESKGSTLASKIKSHHNVGGLPAHIPFTLLEPMKNYYKDEVRELGRRAGLPKEIVTAQPWPGPGYAINIRGEVTQKRLEQIRAADTIVVEEMTRAGLYDKVFECWPVMTGAYSTAVKGDERVFAEVIAIRSIDSHDVMTAEWTRIPYDVLARMSSRIVNEVPDVSRVVYDITSKPPATMRWE